MQYDRPIKISTGNSRKATFWPTQTLLWSEFAEKLRVPARGTESLAEYLRLPKSQQDELKDVGGFVAGTLRNNRRKAGNVEGRDVLTLDLDNVPAGCTDDVLRRLEGLTCGYAVYSTRKHEPAAPRLRVLLPLNRTVTADEYEPLARKLAEIVGIQLCDPSTFEASRLMYWPSCCVDSQYVYRAADKPFADADSVLAMYADWRDMTQWPEVPGAPQLPARLAAKQGDPVSKPGVVGAFCRVYDVYRVIEDLLPDVYAPTDIPGRYTYAAGSTAGGAVIYDGGKFLFSHHATDPCGGKLVNAFDLVRLHLYGDEDDEAKPDTPINKLPSYTAMSRRAVSDAAVALELNKDRYDSAMAGFSVPAEEQDANWLLTLKTNPQTARPQSTLDNIWIILEHDPLLAGKFALNSFAGRGEVRGALPWDGRQGRRPWEDNDNHGMYWYLEKTYGITGSAKIDSALSLHSTIHAFNEVEDYLKALVWDGVPRLDTLFVDYLGAADTPYTRAVTRKSFAAAVARAMMPGVKFDCMTILSGPQGIGKSTLLDKLSCGWFNDGIRTFEGKEASELLQGVWLVEISELDAFRSTDVSRIKQFLSLHNDRFRAAYGRHVKEIPRRCVFFGTTNTSDYLQDKTGNRRFWPVDVDIARPTKSVFSGLEEERDQIWAEAVARWRQGEPLYLEGAIAGEAYAQQESHRETDPREGLIREFIEKPVPRDWFSWPLDRRRAYWAGSCMGEVEAVARDRVCAAEVWCELFGKSSADLPRRETQIINSVLASTEGWSKYSGVLRYGVYGSQRGFVREGYSRDQQDV